MASYCTISILAIFLLVTAVLHLGQGVAISSEPIEVPGYTLLGQWQDPNSRNTRAISYYLSDPGFEKNQFQAYLACPTEIGGKVASILNKSQFDAIRLKILSSGRANDFWIDGQQSGSIWYYYFNGLQIQPSQLIWNPNCENSDSCGNALTDQGLTIGGNVAQFGMCLRSPSQLLSYICEI